MLKNTFCHLPGVGLKKEAHLWEDGIYCWDDFLSANQAGDYSHLKAQVDEAKKRLGSSDALYFSRHLPPAESWRLLGEFKDSVAYIDIETNGFMGRAGYITAITLYDGKDIRHYVSGLNLDDFPDDIKRFKLIVTYNGRCFDIPFIESFFGISLAQAHIDLRFVLKSLGIKGGLKGCEKVLGIDRGSLDGVDGYFAVLLWNDYLRTKKRATLETLLAYNMEDTVNLEMLAVYAHNLKLKSTPFYAAQKLRVPERPPLPFKPDIKTIRRVAAENGYYLNGR